MSEIPTDFPPQTYSSSYFLNLAEDDKGGGGGLRVEGVGNKKKFRLTKGKGESSTLLDCFIKTFLLQSTDKDIEVADFWKSRRANSKGSSERSDSPRNAFKRWRKNVGLKSQNTNSNKSTATAATTTTSSSNNTHEKKKDEDMSLLKFLAINALDLSAPASDVLLKSRNSGWFQLSGHPDSLAPAGPGTVWKKRSGGPDDTERLVYEEISQDPAIRDIVPKYYREVEYKGEKFIELQDLLHGFQDPYVIDVKMGTRTFLESEVRKSIARPDLYQKMVAIDPSAPTREEHQCKGVTKLRYMQFRELQSSSCSRGFRIEAMKCRGSPPVTDLKTVKSVDEVNRTLDLFLNNREDVKQRLLYRLNEMRGKIEQSEYFRGHEVVGSSVFMIYDDNKVGAWLIDFAKTNKLRDGVTVNHRRPWIQGNHEEGLLFGFDQLIQIIEDVKISSSPNNDPFSKALPTVTVKS